MPIALAFIAGSCGLVGSEVSPHFSRAGFRIAGLDNNQRAVFFGPARDTSWILERLRTAIPGYQHYSVDVRDRDAILRLAAELRPGVIIHTAAQPSHDRAAAIPFDDFDNAVSTLNLLEGGSSQYHTIARARDALGIRRSRLCRRHPRIVLHRLIEALAFRRFESGR